MNPDPSRIPAMDIARGVAVLGILAMNIVAYAMPEAAYINPRAWGGTGSADIAAWFAAFLLVDGKMRGLFSLLYGAGILLVMDSAEMRGGDGRRAMIARSLALLGLGLAHYLLLWWGDILALYAVIGLVAMLLAHRTPVQLAVAAFAAFATHFLLLLVFLWWIRASSLMVSPDDMMNWSYLLEALGEPGSAAIAQEAVLLRGDFGDIFADKLMHMGGWVLGAQYMALDTLGFMLLGMAMLKGGFLSARWTAGQYRAVARHCFLLGLPVMLGLGLWVLWTGFDTVTTFAVVFVWSFPLRIPLTVGWAALIYWLALRRPAPVPPAGQLARRLEAAGRMALSNYLGSSLLMTALFYGWGLGLFGMVSRAPLYGVVLAMWVVILGWSQPWLRAFRLGPAEWLWRSMAGGRLLPLRRGSGPA